MDKASEIIGKNVSALRAKKGLTQGELADLAGVAISTIGSLEGGRKGPKLDTLCKVIDAFGISYCDFFRSVDIELKKESSPNTAITIYEWLINKTTDQQEQVLSVLKVFDGFNRF